MKQTTVPKFGENAFDLLRIFAAIQVFIGHVNNNMGLPLGIFAPLIYTFPGMLILFSLGGYLVTASLERTSSKKEFIQKRIFRIFPEYWLSVIVNLVVIISISHIVCSGMEFFKWFLLQMLAVDHTPDFLSFYGTGQFNAALYAIFIELQFYVLTMLFYHKLKKIKKSGWIITILLFIFLHLLITCYRNYMGEDLMVRLLRRTFIPYFSYYLIGMFVYTYRQEFLPKLMKAAVPLTVLLIIYRYLTSIFHIEISSMYSDPLTGLLLPLITLGLAYRLGKIRFKRDYSYSIYLYHMVIIGAFVQLNIKLNLQSIILLIILVLVLSVVSKHVVDFIDALWKRRKNCRL